MKLKKKSFDHFFPFLINKYYPLLFNLPDFQAIFRIYFFSEFFYCGLNFLLFCRIDLYLYDLLLIVNVDSKHFSNSKNKNVFKICIVLLRKIRLISMYVCVCIDIFIIDVYRFKKDILISLILSTCSFTLFTCKLLYSSLLLWWRPEGTTAKT